MSTSSTTDQTYINPLYLYHTKNTIIYCFSSCVFNSCNAQKCCLLMSTALKNSPISGLSQNKALSAHATHPLVGTLLTQSAPLLTSP